MKALKERQLTKVLQAALQLRDHGNSNACSDRKERSLRLGSGVQC